MPVSPSVFLALLVSQWAVATLALLVLGARRWRRGTPGAGWATLAAVALLTVPAVGVGLVLLSEFQVRPFVRLFRREGDLGPVLLAVAAGPAALCGVAAAASFRGAAAARAAREPGNARD